jgi:hypothetical protein
MEESFDNEELMEFLKEAGAVDIDGIDDDGEFIYSFNMPVLKEVFPPLFEAIAKDIDNSLLELYKKGLIEVSYDEELNAEFKLSDEAKSILTDMGFEDLFDEN